MALKKTKPDPRFTSKKKTVALAHARGTSVEAAKKQDVVERDIARIKKGVVRPVRDAEGFTAMDRQIGKNKQLQAGRQAATAQANQLAQTATLGGEMQPGGSGFWTTKLGEFLSGFLNPKREGGESFERGTPAEVAGQTLGAASTIAAIGGAPGFIDDALAWANQGIKGKATLDTAKTIEVASQIKPGLKKLLSDALSKVFDPKRVVGNVKVTSRFTKGRVSVPYIPAENLYKATTTLTTASKLVAGNAKNAGLFKQITKGAFTGLFGLWFAWEIYQTIPFGDFIGSKSQATLNFMQQDAIKTGDQDLINDVFQLSEEMLDEESNRNMEKGTPFLGQIEAYANERDVNRLRLTLNRYINDQESSGMSEQDIYNQYLADKTESELMLINAYEESAMRISDYKQAANDEGNKAAVAYWDAKAARDSKKLKDDQIWLANMWLEYTKMKGEIGTPNLPSNLNFGLI